MNTIIKIFVFCFVFIWGLLILNGVLSVVYEKMLDKNFDKVEFVKIESIEKENYDGNTYFVVTTEEGEVVMVDAREYPEIRETSVNSKIKYIYGSFEGGRKLYKLELKN